MEPFEAGTEVVATLSESFRLRDRFALTAGFGQGQAFPFEVGHENKSGGPRFRCGLLAAKALYCGKTSRLAHMIPPEWAVN
jgi:hypothetical protein